MRKSRVDLVINKFLKVDQVLGLVQEGMELKRVIETCKEEIGIPNGS